MRPASLPDPDSQRPDGRGKSWDERRDEEDTVTRRAEAEAPAFLTSIIWLGVIGLCLMAFDAISPLGGGLLIVLI